MARITIRLKTKTTVVMTGDSVCLTFWRFNSHFGAGKHSNYSIIEVQRKHSRRRDETAERTGFLFWTPALRVSSTAFWLLQAYFPFYPLLALRNKSQTWVGIFPFAACECIVNIAYEICGRMEGKLVGGVLQW